MSCGCCSPEYFRERKKKVCVVSCRVLTRYRYDRIASAGVDAGDVGKVEIS